MSKGEITNIVDKQMMSGKSFTEAVIVVANILNHEQPIDPVLYYQQLVGGE